MSIPFAIYDAVLALCEADADPVLTGGEVAAAIARTAGYASWAASTVVPFGATVGPVTGNGWLYTVATPGTTGATEPIWAVPESYRNPYARVADGSVIWLASVPTAGLPFDVRAAASECWLMKARKAANRFAFAADGQSAHPETTYDRCVAMAKSLRPMAIF